MKVINVKKNSDITELAGLTKRNREKLKDVAAAVEVIINDVKENGDAALKHYAEKFDNVKLDSVVVTPEEIEEAYNSVSPELIAVLEEARDNIRAFHEKQVYAPVMLQTEGKKLYQMVTPVKRAGLYVPGGNYPYPSTVLMDSVPAMVAGVKEIVMITPAKGDGKVNANILATAKVCGITEIYKSGGAQAIAALAYGTESIRPVDMICGPGNVYVTAAKRSVFGDVNIDMLAGPSE
ncbi:MAG: histidinol dehydrogenase, partial [Anaerofustis stercorihominis]|nr:histidinol dehydrogenase [Anaerofustis stercorihominis]